MSVATLDAYVPEVPGRRRAVAPDVVESAGAATLVCLARFGVAKQTVDDVARDVRSSRATLYRAFASKRALVASAVAAEIERVTAAVLAAGSSADTLDDAAVAVIATGARELADSPAFRFVTEHEPELVHPHLSFAGGDRFLADASRRLAPVFTRWCDDAERAAEWVVRVGLTLVWSPAPVVDVADHAALHAYVATFVTPGLAALRSPEEH